MKLFSSVWWRFDQSIITRGRISPAKGAVIQRFDPWSEYRQPTEKNVTRQPYHALLDLLNHIEQPETIKERDSRILGWCRQYGLLGILLHSCESVTIPFTDHNGTVMGYREYSRETRGWRDLRR